MKRIRKEEDHDWVEEISYISIQLLPAIRTTFFSPVLISNFRSSEYNEPLTVCRISSRRLLMIMSIAVYKIPNCNLDYALFSSCVNVKNSITLCRDSV